MSIMSNTPEGYSLRYTVLCLVQDWIFEENQFLFSQHLADFSTRLQLEVQLVDRDDQIAQFNNQLRMFGRRVEALEAALRYAEDANMQLADQNNHYRRHIGQCLQCRDPPLFRTPPQRRRVRRRIIFEPVETSGDDDATTTEHEELPSDPDDVEL